MMGLNVMGLWKMVLWTMAVEDGVLQIVEDARCCGQCADVEDMAVLYLRHSLCQ